MSSQLLQFKVKNYRSFYGEQVLDFRNKGQARQATAIYGPNASGKSNIAHALEFVRTFIINSNNAQLIRIPRDPFLLKSDSDNESTSFEIEILADRRHLVYGFSLDTEAVEHEYLREYASKTNKPRLIFDRKDGKLNSTAEKYKFGRKLLQDTRPGTLLLTKARESNNDYSNAIFGWLENINILHSNLDKETLQWSLKELKADAALHEEVLDFMQQADLWIKGYDIKEVELPKELLDSLPLNELALKQLMESPDKPSSIQTIHAVRDKDQKIVSERPLDWEGQESTGTKKFFELAAPILNTLKHGKMLYIDEFGSSMHPDMCEFIVALFKSKQNVNGAQLIVNTHDTYLMSADDLLDREDIVFVEKNYAEESVIEPLSSKRSVRLDERFEKRYRQGFYGAKPRMRKVQ